ncbi:MAG: ribbon-helix-helix protein, CopG family [Planctomycetaceae bacterium]
MATDRLSLRLPEPLRTGLEAMVESTGRTESDLAREAIEEYLLRHGKLPTCFDLAQAAGLIGCVDSGKGDLSTNPKHMEGFGR